MPDCMCKIIQQVNEPGEIEFCPLHKGAARMLQLLTDIKNKADGYTNAVGDRHPCQRSFIRLGRLADQGIKTTNANK